MAVILPDYTGCDVDHRRIPAIRPGSWVAIQRNPSSGSGRGNREILRLVSELRSRGIRPRLFSRRADLDAAVHDPGLRSSLACIVAAGGDGTLLDIVNRHPRIPIAILPLGTENLFARAIKVPRCGRSVAAMIASGKRHRFDAALCNERRFLIVASAGFDAEVIRHAHERRQGRISRWFYILPILRTLSTYEYPPVRVWIDDEPVPIEGALAVIGNLPTYALRLPIVASARGDDGLLDVRIFQRPGLRRLAGDLLAVVMQRHERLAHVSSCRARRLRIDAEHPVPVQLDGDAAGTTPIEITLEPGAVEILVP
jgi:YegS/Rv2252/BmrU family lipid kinase